MTIYFPVNKTCVFYVLIDVVAVNAVRLMNRADAQAAKDEMQGHFFSPH